jgi:Fe-S-cluster containining protein
MARVFPIEDSAAITPRERQVLGVYARIDEAIGRELDRLRHEEGIVPSCQRGCCSCCGQHIQLNPVEAHTLGQHIKRTFSRQQIDGLKRRTRRWLAWEAVRRQGDTPDESDEDLAEPCCPLLVERICSVYPVRPVICRTHYVRSDPSACRAAHDPRPSEPAPVALTSIIQVTQPLSQLFRAEIEAAGLDYSRSIMLLPHWLAVEMGWELGLKS